MIDASGLGWVEWEPVLLETPTPYATGDRLAEHLTDFSAVIGGDSTVVAFNDLAEAFESADLVEVFEDFVPESLPDWSTSWLLLNESSLSLIWLDVMAVAGALIHSLFVHLRRSPALLPIVGSAESTCVGNSSVSTLNRVYPKNGPPTPSLATGT